MIKWILLLCIMFPLIMVAQKQKKMTLKEQVALAKEQEAQAKAQAEKPMTKIGSKLPAFYANSSDDKIFSDTSLPLNKKFILVFFNPTCDHCMQFCKKVYQNISTLKDVTCLFVTGNNLWSELPEFIKLSKVTPSDKLVIAAEVTELSKLLFNYYGIPQIMLYDQNKILQKVFYKDADIDSIQHYLHIKN